MNPSLLNDIRNFTESKNKLFKIFHNVRNLYDQEEIEDLSEIVYDFIYLYLYGKSMCGKPSYFHIVLRRRIVLSTKSNEFIDHLINTLDKNALIHVYWGLFTIDERNNILSNATRHLEVLYRSTL